MYRIGIAAASVLVLVAFTPVAGGHPTDTFRACGVVVGGGACMTNVTYHYGDTVRLRGRVDPPHSQLRAVVQRNDPGPEDWHRVGSAGISDEGKIRWTWRTRRADADQDDPYRFRFRIPGHGRSNRVLVWVLFGE